jgi:catechol 2,3-dioxygenase-like lactoylglutathione lyase family enzyme
MSGVVAAITSFRLTTAAPARLSRFYGGLGFTLTNREAIPERELELLGLKGGGTRLRLRLGAQCVDLDSFDEPGRPYPADTTSADLCFQHLALVTDDASAAWARATELGAVPISTDGPVKLPVSAGGVTAVKFRDPDGHPLELLQFPLNRTSSWRGTGLLGIDHSAISVSDAGVSRCFYEALGLAVHGPTLNRGPTQAALDGLSAPIVDVVPMIPRGATPHLELLAYRTPSGGRLDRLAANDVAATRIIWDADRDALVHDPDGHLHLLHCSTLSTR